MAGGRPTLYDPKYCQMLEDYFSEAPYREVTRKTKINGEEIENTKLEATDFKSLAGFALSIGVHSETLLNWSKEHAEFFESYKKAKDYQQLYLTVNGNRGLINTAFGIFTAKNVIGWADRLEQKTEHKSEGFVVEFTEKTDKPSKPSV